MRVTFLALIIVAAPAYAHQELAPYSWQVKQATRDQRKIPHNPVYVWPWVKNAGAYEFKKGMTVAQLIKMAGGLKLDERYPDIPDIQRPKTLSVYRPSSEVKDPTHSIYQCKLDWDKPEAGLVSCDLPLQKGDLVAVSMSPAVP
jgi:protein involved in polysaccharide export with SLBB domain